MTLSNGVIRELRTHFLSLDRKNVIRGSVVPSQDDTLTLGSPTRRYHAIYANRIIGDTYENITSGGGDSTGGHADTLGEDYLTASSTATIGNLFPLKDDGSGNPVFPAYVIPSEFVREDTSVSFDTITVTNLVDGINLSIHDHSGGQYGQQVDHGDLLNLTADHHTMYARWDAQEKIIKEWKFTNIADENHSFDEYVGWSIKSSVALSGDPPTPDASTAQAVIQTLAFSDPTYPSYDHAYPLRIIAHAEYSAIQMGSVSSPDLELRNDASDVSLTLGNTVISNTNGIDVNGNFTVDTLGNLVAKAGYIGSEADGWEILTDKLQGSGGDVVLDNDGFIKVANPNDQKVLISSYDYSGDPSNDFRLWIGSYGETSHTPTTAKFVVTTSGSVVAENFAVKGLMQSYGTDKWTLTSGGHLEVQSIKARGRLDTIVYSKNTVSSVSGTMSLSKGATLAAEVSSSDTEIYVDVPDFSYGDIALVQPDADSIEWWLFSSQSEQVTIQNEDGEDVTAYKYTVTRDYDSVSGETYTFEQGTAVNGRGSYAGGNSPHPLASGDLESAYGDYQPAGAYSGSGGGWLRLSGEEGFIGVDVRTGPLPLQYQNLIRIGNLQGWLDYTAVEWGFAVGDANNYLSFDQTNGLIYYTRDGATQIDASGIVSDSLRLTKEITPVPADLPNDSAQIYFDGTDLRFRKDISGTETTQTLATESYVSGAYLPLSGGTLTGELTISSGGLDVTGTVDLRGNTNLRDNKLEFTNFEVVYDSVNDALNFNYVG